MKKKAETKQTVIRVRTKVKAGFTMNRQLQG